MTRTASPFLKPKLRSGIEVTFDVNAATVEYRTQGCAINYPPEGRTEIERLFSLLKNGAAVSALADACPGISHQLSNMLITLDRLGLLQESEFPRIANGWSGVDFYRDIRRYAERAKRLYANSHYYKTLTGHETTREQIIGYAIEYYHIVIMGPVLIAPVLAHINSRATRELLQDFISSEFGHDKMIARALESVGITRSQLDSLQPLPWTFTVCATLGVLAAQDPLSFKSSLFLFEQPYGEFNEALVERCKELELPSAFYEPLLQHADINEFAEHGDISGKLLEDVKYVSVEEGRVAKKHVALLIESLGLMEKQILQHYEQAGSVNLRNYE
jgi:pyrroloquinoline quinone (PQQ) biosynthesis protein C